MRKVYLFLTSLLLSMAFVANAQTLLDEDFESTQSDVATTQLPDGWTAVTSYTGTHTGYRWTIGHNSTASQTMGGYHYAYCDAPTYDKGDGDGTGPRKDYLITPELKLDGNYQLAFDWEAAAYACLSQKHFTLQVAIIDMANPSDTTVIFDIQNEQQVRDSGVPNSPYNDYIWQNWAIHNSKLDLDSYKGKTIKIAFIYNLQYTFANIAYLDNVSVKAHEAITSPIAELSQNSYTFEPMYLGEKHYSEQITLKNVGKKGLKVLGYEAPDGITLNMDTAGLDLGINETATFQIAYTANLTTPTDADFVLKTNGGDVTVKVKATKEAVPDGYTLELFEGRQFAPAGWKNDGWGTTLYAIEGDLSAYGTGNFEATYLTTPRLDLSKADAPHDIQFSFYNMFTGEDAPYNDLVVEASSDNGVTWDSLWCSDYNQLDTLMTIKVDLSKYTTDNVRVRFKNTAISYDSDEGSDEWSTLIVDRVLLPNVYGQDGVPFASEVVSPADSATQVYTKNVQFKWKEAQFADGYKLYIGKSNGNWDVVNGQDMGNALEYKMLKADYETTYYWKVVPYNTVGSATEVPVWTFTTQSDHSVKEFPWTEDFESGTFAPLGWNLEKTTLSKWTASDYFPYDGKFSAIGYSNETEVSTCLNTPDIDLPADSKYHLSFMWGNAVPVSLTIDNTKVHTNATKAEDGIDAVFCEIQVDGEWQQLAMISNNTEADGNQYWCYENIDLSPYAGKNVAIRWRYISHNYNRSRGAALDNVKISDEKANISFSTDGWDAYKVNYAETETSPEFGMTNLGSQTATISSVKFNTSYFTTTLQEGDQLEPSGSKQFTVSFKASLNDADSTEVEDMMTVAFSSGDTITFPVAAIAMAQDMKFFGFEHDATGAVPEHFTGINVDGSASEQIYYWTFPNNGGNLSFFVLNDSECYNQLKEPHGSQSMMTRCNSEGAFDKWLVSEKIQVNANAKFVFNARTWESTNSVLPAGGPTINVWVSDSSATDRTTFTQIGTSKTLALYSDTTGWDKLSYSLAAYAGKKVYVAVESTSSDCLGAFFDNFEFQHCGDFAVRGDVNGDGLVNVTDLTELIGAILGTNPWKLDVMDLDNNNDLNVSDVIYLIRIITNGGAGAPAVAE